MITLFQVIVVFLVLLLLSFAAPKLHPILYVSIFFFFLLHLLITVIMPFGKTFAKLFEPLPDPFAKLLIGSVLLYYLSELIAKHMAEAGYASLAALSHFAVKIAILTLWIQQTSAVIKLLSSLLSK
ncbi:hypothetical protein [Sporosarcina sp. HYO08]|uniref:hypothetical protein n=1 Tax=Sporosarcina sp. HYO08 TaxID=1759557 RepID=UPI00079C842A|nr:hypothetical protein [Sporosarcina sp. HYO08]KXH87478.1 hypothetical protein AU377_02615 [Sporosarcina sp. HYO08]